MTEMETMRRAKYYMDMLAQGIDPVTGESCPEDSVLNQAKLVRCFFYVSDVLKQNIEKGGTTLQGKGKIPFSVLPEQLRDFPYVNGKMRITEFTQRLYQAAQNPQMKKPQFNCFTNWLLRKGFLKEEIEPDGKKRRVPTHAGYSIGITCAMRKSDFGEYMAVYYDLNAQRFLIDHICDILPQK